MYVQYSIIGGVKDAIRGLIYLKEYSEENKCRYL